ncbi:two-component sensor histidine kinase [Alkalibacter rhizosphaerae]|uniref:histidine kinase n=1 Tax=Alkalibacter rhizosphaerae TaxID=2815577 RepID=A0A974XD38_9FIRM|nr:histidine kinase [Alkalibacter rhizosphaerae]QSX07622.1 two-component sensor histidine kinase [Alkalibacter rhizosphaerae]
MSRWDYTDRIILYGTGLVLFGVFRQTSIMVAPILVSIIGLGLITYLEEGLLRSLVGFAYGLACFYEVSLCYFLPSILYGLYTGEKTAWRLLAAWPLVYYLTGGNRELTGVILLGLVAVLLKNRTIRCCDLEGSRKQLEDAHRQLTYDTKRQNQLLLEKQDGEIHMATLDERNRIAREIHDNVGHQLSSALLQVGALLVTQPQVEGLQTLKKTLDKAMDNIRTSVHDLHDRSIDLDAQLVSLAEEFNFCEIDLSIQVDNHPQGPLKYAVIAMVKEGLSNIIKHSNASRVEVVFMEHPGFYQLRISDNGTIHKIKRDEGIGLKNIQQRVDALKGRFLVRQERGFTLFVTLPKEEIHESDHR